MPTTANAVCVANSLRCKIPHVKAFFAVLTDERNAELFLADEREVIRGHVPWTRVVADVRTAHDENPSICSPSSASIANIS